MKMNQAKTLYYKSTHLMHLNEGKITPRIGVKFKLGADVKSERNRTIPEDTMVEIIEIRGSKMRPNDQILYIESPDGERALVHVNSIAARYLN